MGKLEEKGKSEGRDREGREVRQIDRQRGIREGGSEKMETRGNII